MQIYNDEELFHYGVIGMKWGKRKYDGHTLSIREKKGISKEYSYNMKKANLKIAKKRSDIETKSLNRTADDMNNGGIDKFNSQQKAKHGPKYISRNNHEDYISDYEKLFNNTYDKHKSKLLTEAFKNDDDFKKANQLVDKYKMLDWDELAINNLGE